jgi:hypothetical protein
MHVRRSILAGALALIVSLLPAIATPVIAQTGNPHTSAVAVPITQPIAGLGTFTGQFVVNSVKVVNGQLQALGTVTGRITDPTTGALLGTVATSAVAPVAAAGSCSILHLTLGPLDLNLLGLMVHLDQVVLDITAQSGAGNLLGNLLCSVANLLNGGGTLSQIAGLLNQILAAL